MCRRKRGKTYISKNTKDAPRKQGVRKVRKELEGWKARKSKHFKEEQQCTRHQMSQRNTWKREPLLQEASDESSTLQSSCCGEGQNSSSMVIHQAKAGRDWVLKGNRERCDLTIKGWREWAWTTKRLEMNYRRIISPLWWDNFQPLKMIQGWWSCL